MLCANEQNYNSAGSGNLLFQSRVVLIYLTVAFLAEPCYFQIRRCKSEKACCQLSAYHSYRSYKLLSLLPGFGPGELSCQLLFMFEYSPERGDSCACWLPSILWEGCLVQLLSAPICPYSIQRRLQRLTPEPRLHRTTMWPLFLLVSSATLYLGSGDVTVMKEQS